MRRKLVNWDTGDVYKDDRGEVVAWNEGDPEAEVKLLGMKKGLWALVPVEYQFGSMVAQGKTWR